MTEDYSDSNLNTISDISDLCIITDPYIINICDLPHELLMIIFSYIPLTQEVSSVCRKFYSITLIKSVRIQRHRIVPCMCIADNLSNISICHAHNDYHYCVCQMSPHYAILCKAIKHPCICNMGAHSCLRCRSCNHPCCCHMGIWFWNICKYCSRR